VKQLEAEVFDLAGRIAVGTYELLVLVGELDHRGSWATWGSLSCAAWLADACDIAVSTAQTQVRVAKAMREFPALDEAMRTGDVSYAKARVLAAYLTESNVGPLLEIAERTPAGRLGVAIAAWSQRNDDPDQIAARQELARGLSWHPDPDGMVVGTFRLVPDDAGAVCAVIDTQVTRNTAPAGATLAQQRADALVSLVTGRHRSPAETVAADTVPGPGGQNGSTDRTVGGSSEVGESTGPGPGSRQIVTEVVVHVREDGNTLTDGTPLSDHAVAKLIPDSFISLLIHDSQRQPIDASPRRRHPTRRQRRVLDELNPECNQPGCHAVNFLQYDHVQPHALGGPTVIANLQRLCGPHNRAREDSAGSGDEARGEATPDG